MNELRALLDEPNETLGVEYKSWLDLSDGKHRADLARHIAALANHGGGYIVFGFDDVGLAPSLPSPHPFPDRDSVSAIVQKYLEPNFQCEVQLLRSTAGNDHPVITVPGHGAVPICSKAGGPEIDGKPLGIVKGVYYSRQLGPKSDVIRSPADWQPIIRRCAMHERTAILGAISAALDPRAASEANLDPLKQWHAAAEAEFQRQWANVESQIDASKHHVQFSFMVTTFDNQRLTDSELRAAVREINHEVKDTVNTGWSMFYPFERPAVQWIADAASGEGEEDFLQCSHLAEQSFGHDFWRISRTGKVTLIREFWEDGSYWVNRGVPRYTVFDPRLAIKHVAEVVRYARGFAERFQSPRDVAFLVEWQGLSGRKPGGEHHFRFLGRESAANSRTSTGVWPAGDLDVKFADVVSALVAPIGRNFSVESMMEPQAVRQQAPGWLRT